VRGCTKTVPLCYGRIMNSDGKCTCTNPPKFPDVRAAPAPTPAASAGELELLRELERLMRHQRMGESTPSRLVDEVLVKLSALRAPGGGE